MIDVTDFFSGVREDRWLLEEFLVFWMCVAGKPAKQTAQKVEHFLHWLHLEMFARENDSGMPFELIEYAHANGLLRDALKRAKMGKYELLSKGLPEAARLNPLTCTLEELEAVHGIGPKTARCFLLHSRPDQRLAGLDTHLLKFLAQHGFQVPKTTPTGRLYLELEQRFLDICDNLKEKPSFVDITVWKYYAGEYIPLPEMDRVFRLSNIRTMLKHT